MSSSQYAPGGIGSAWSMSGLLALWVGTLEERVDERGDCAGLREHEQQTEQHEHQDDGDQPVLLLLTEKRQEFPEDATLAHIDLLLCVTECGARRRQATRGWPGQRAVPP